MKKNIPLLKRLRTRFLRMKHPKHFQMKGIAVKTDCGASMCFIGHTLDIAGYKMRYRGPQKGLQWWAVSRNDYEFVSPDGKVFRSPRAVAGEAARLLGLRHTGNELVYGEAGRLFNDFDIKTPKQAAKRVQQMIEAA